MTDKTLLVLGNGFDRAHILKSTGKSLPTGYGDFLNYVVGNCKIHSNFWLNLFYDRRNEIGDFWMDFEKEIANVICYLECNALHKKIPDEYKYVESFLVRIETSPFNNIQVKLIPQLEKDLKDLMLLLEDYLLRKVDKLKIDDISKFPEVIYQIDNIKAVITYNYTHLFEHLYSEWNKKFYFRPDAKVEHIYHIHGELGAHNIILGSGETLDENDITSMVLCNSFKKYFQRIYFCLSNNYQMIFPNYGIDKEAEEKLDPFAKHFPLADKPDPEWNLVVYGHSLDVTDKDSLFAMMINELTDKIIVYYYDNNALKRQIQNAIQILGKNRLTTWTGKGKLVFKSITK